MPRGLKLTGSRVLITGGGSGIGRLMALGAARRGAAEILIWDLSPEHGTAIRDELIGLGCRAQAVTINVADRDAVRRAAEDTSPVDVVIHSAGVVTGEKLLDTTEDAVQRTFEVNVLALYWVTRAFLGDMIERDHGAVVTIASAAGLVGVAKQTDYSASKFAAIGFMESLRHELQAEGSRVGTLTVCPYYINTGMFEGVTTRFPLLLPILDEVKVATRILAAIESGRQQLIMPWLPNLLPAMRLLPVPVFDRIIDFFGINRTMERFTGRGVPESATPSDANEAEVRL